MIACHMKAKYIFMYVGLTTMIWKMQQVSSKSRSWFLIQLIWWVEELNVGHSGVFVLHLFVFVFFLSSSSSRICQFCGSLMAGGNESHVCQGKQKCLLSKLDICTAKFDIYVTSFVFSTLEHWTLNVQCSMFNLPILDVWHALEGCSYRQGQRSRIWKWGRYALSPRWSYFESS